MDPLVAPLLAAALLAGWLALRAVARRRAGARRWRVVTRTGADGTHTIVLAGPGGAEQQIAALPGGLDEASLTGALRQARAEAFSRAEALNGPSPVPAPARVPRTGS